MLTKEQRNNVQFKKGQIVHAYNRLIAVADWFKQNGEMIGEDPYTPAASVADELNSAAQKLEIAIMSIGYMTGGYMTSVKEAK